MTGPTSGRLVVVPTPIGNLEDITFRAIRWLKSADVIAAEDTRRTKKLLNHYQLTTPLISYYQEVEKRKTQELINRIKRGEVVALVSDAGMPTVSDPGQLLIKQARQEHLAIEVLPGPSAVMTALTGSGLLLDHFTFYGFPAAKSSHRKRHFDLIKDRQESMIFFVTPHKLKAILQDMIDCWQDREAVLCREMTKIHEEFISGTLDSINENLPEKILGEMTLIVAGCLNPAPKTAESMDEHLKRYVAEGASTNQAVARVAKERGLPREAVYRFAHELFNMLKQNPPDRN